MELPLCNRPWQFTKTTRHRPERVQVPSRAQQEGQLYQVALWSLACQWNNSSVKITEMWRGWVDKSTETQEGSKGTWMSRWQAGGEEDIPHPCSQPTTYMWLSCPTRISWNLTTTVVRRSPGAVYPHSCCTLSFTGRKPACFCPGTRLIYFGLPILEIDRAKSTSAGQGAGWADGWLETPLHTLSYLCWLQQPVVPFSIPCHTQSPKHNTRVLQQWHQICTYACTTVFSVSKASWALYVIYVIYKQTYQTAGHLRNKRAN